MRIFWNLKEKLENKCFCKILILRCNNRKEITSHWFGLICKQAGNECQPTTPYTPEKMELVREVT